jgi:hypothetical protein
VGVDLGSNEILRYWRVKLSDIEVRGGWVLHYGGKWVRAQQNRTFFGQLWVAVGCERESDSLSMEVVKSGASSSSSGSSADVGTEGKGFGSGLTDAASLLSVAWWL